MRTIEKRSMAGRQGGFTLIEIMVVIAIIVILAGISVAVGVGVKKQSAVKATKAELLTLDGLMKKYLDNSPDFPTTGLDTAAINPYPASDTILFVRAIQGTGEATSVQSLTFSTDKTNVLDAFGTPIHFVPAGLTPDKRGYFWSAGPDRTLCTSDDIRSIEAQ